MQILLTTHQFLPEFTSGTEVLTFEVARELESLGHDVRILTGWPADLLAETSDVYDRYRYEGIDVYRVRPLPTSETTVAGRMRAEFDNPRAAAAFKAIVATWRPDIVHFFHLQRLSSSVVKACVEAGIPTVYTATDFWSICPLHKLRLPDGSVCAGPNANSSNCVLHFALQGRRASLSPLYRWVPAGLVGAVLHFAPDDEDSNFQNLAAARALQERASTMRSMLETFDRIVAPTSFMARRVAEFGAPARTLVELGYGIDMRQHADPSPLLPTACLRIGFIGTLHEHKGAHVLIDAVRKLDPARDCTLRIYGDESFYPEYVARIRASAADDARIAFCGTFPREDIARTIDGFDVLVVPSTWSENTPLVVLAAQASGRPVIGSNVAGISEVIEDGVNGRLFEAGNSTALADILGELLDNHALLTEMGLRAVPLKDISRYVADLLDLYADIRNDRALRSHAATRVHA